MALLAGQHALITGSSRGIGLAIARALAAEGAAISLLARTRPEMPEAEARVFCIAADVTDDAELRHATAAAVQALGPIGILVNNAGGVKTGPFVSQDLEVVRSLFDLNVMSVFALTRLVLPGMLERGQGRIVNVASTAGLKGYPYIAAYTASKHAVIGLTRALALEVAKSGVTVNAVCPGYTETEMVAASAAEVARKTGRSEQAVRAEFAKSNPQGRLVTPEEVAAAVVYLAGPAASAVNGVALPVAGGEVG